MRKILQLGCACTLGLQRGLEVVMFGNEDAEPTQNQGLNCCSGATGTELGNDVAMGDGGTGLKHQLDALAFIGKVRSGGNSNSGKALSDPRPRHARDLCLWHRFMIL